jgi:multidrug efflux system outer membrane protein
LPTAILSWPRRAWTPRLPRHALRAPRFPSFGPAGGGTDADVLSITNNNFSVSLDLAWELDLWGRLREARSAARETFAAAEADWAAARHSIAGQTAKAWFAAVEADRQWRIALANDRSFTASAERVRARYQRGLRPALDLRAAEAESAAARAVLARRESVRDAALRALELLLGRYPSAALEVQAGLPEVEAPVPAGLPIDLLGRRADLVASERRLEAALAGGREARAALLPSISLTGSMGRSSEELSDLLDGSFGVWQIGGRLVQPIFQGGRLRAAVALADARAAEAAASYGDRVLRAAAEVERALFDDRVAVAEAEALTAAAALSAAAAATAESRYHAGLESFTTLLVQQRARADAEARALEAHRRRLDRRIDLHLALGGGFEAASSAAPKATAETPASTESPS